MVLRALAGSLHRNASPGSAYIARVAGSSGELQGVFFTKNVGASCEQYAEGLSTHAVLVQTIPPAREPRWVGDKMPADLPALISLAIGWGPSTWYTRGPRRRPRGPLCSHSYTTRLVLTPFEFYSTRRRRDSVIFLRQFTGYPRLCIHGHALPPPLDTACLGLTVLARILG